MVELAVLLVASDLINNHEILRDVVKVGHICLQGFEFLLGKEQ